MLPLPPAWRQQARRASGWIRQDWETLCKPACTMLCLIGRRTPCYMELKAEAAAHHLITRRPSKHCINVCTRQRPPLALCQVTQGEAAHLTGMGMGVGGASEVWSGAASSGQRRRSAKGRAWALVHPLRCNARARTWHRCRAVTWCPWLLNMRRTCTRGQMHHVWGIARVWYCSKRAQKSLRSLQPNPRATVGDSATACLPRTWRLSPSTTARARCALAACRPSADSGRGPKQRPPHAA